MMIMIQSTLVELKILSNMFGLMIQSTLVDVILESTSSDPNHCIWTIDPNHCILILNWWSGRLSAYFMHLCIELTAQLLPLLPPRASTN